MHVAQARKANVKKTISEILELEAEPYRKVLAASLQDMLLRIDTVCAITGLSPATLHRLKAQGDFPRPVKLTGYARAWKLSEVMRWIESRDRDVGEASGQEVKQVTITTARIASSRSDP